VSFDLPTGGRGRRCGQCISALLAVVLLAVASGCGKSGHGAETDPEKGADTAILNEALARELTLRDAYTRGLPLLRGRLRGVARGLLAQEGEYVDALTKAIRGVGGATEAEAGELDALDGRAAFLALAYELESAALAAYVDAAPRLYTSAPRTLDASLAAGHAQHLVVLREGLGTGLSGSIPEAFDGGQVPPPGGSGPDGGG
jgi:hypothetical protein